MIAVSLTVGGGVQLIKLAKLYMCTQKHNKARMDAIGALSYSGNMGTRIGLYQQLSYLNP